MTSSSSSTVAATSDIAGRLQKAVERQKDILGAGRVEKLGDVQHKVSDLRSRGLLRRREFVVVTTSDFERRYTTQKKVQGEPIAP